jgi:hypothetical protein
LEKYKRIQKKIVPKQPFLIKGKFEHIKTSIITVQLLLWVLNESYTSAKQILMDQQIVLIRPAQGESIRKCGRNKMIKKLQQDVRGGIYFY